MWWLPGGRLRLCALHRLLRQKRIYGGKSCHHPGLYQRHPAGSGVCKQPYLPEIAETIAPQFEETDLDTITTIVERYKAQDTWKEDLILRKAALICSRIFWRKRESWKKRAPYEDLVTRNLPGRAVSETQ